MAIASAVAMVAMSYLAFDAGVVNSSVVTRPIKVAQASIMGVGMGEHHLAFTVQDWLRSNRAPQEEPVVEHCLAID